jgi:isoleucyl-tRNA synthetase
MWRDLIRGIQNARKEAGFEVTDRIVWTVSGDEELHAALERFSQLVAEETLAVKIEWSDQAKGISVEAGEKTWTVSLAKA